MPDDDCFVFATHDGMIEPCADLGDMVKKGDCLAKIWPVDRTGMAPTRIPREARRAADGAAFPRPGKGRGLSGGASPT
jgi:predicted deacylase